MIVVLSLTDRGTEGDKGMLLALVLVDAAKQNKCKINVNIDECFAYRLQRFYAG
jgi:hypothetical protein